MKVAWTKYNVVNIVVGLVILTILAGLSSYIIVFAFSKNYYVELNEMTLALIISSIVSFYWNANNRKPVARTSIPGQSQGVRDANL
jgi:hypothetical protein